MSSSSSSSFFPFLAFLATFDGFAVAFFAIASIGLPFTTGFIFVVGFTISFLVLFFTSSQILLV
jgi:hypothetical protein